MGFCPDEKETNKQLEKDPEIRKEEKTEAEADVKEALGSLKTRTVAEAIRPLHTPRPLHDSLWAWMFVALFLLCAVSFPKNLSGLLFLAAAFLAAPAFKKFWGKHKVSPKMRALLSAGAAIAATLLIPKGLLM